MPDNIPAIEEKLKSLLAALEYIAERETGTITGIFAKAVIIKVTGETNG